jgi:hypothetical protein
LPSMIIPWAFIYALQAQLRQKEADLKQANAELEERGKLLYKTKVRKDWKATYREEVNYPAACPLCACAYCALTCDYVQVAIEQLQQELTTSRKEEQTIREEAARVCWWGTQSVGGAHKVPGECRDHRRKQHCGWGGIFLPKTSGWHHAQKLKSFFTHTASPDLRRPSS